ncbi:MAG TPA: hypothetical protein VN605_05630 [Thermoanaerobaculia bacterium]|nr:hypothetical protein [Thermoanaerobaculia bacterium]
MNRSIAITLVASTLLLPLAVSTADARVVRVHTNARGTRVRVTSRAGFPIHRALPDVVIRPGVVRVQPHVYVGSVAFGAVVVAQPRPERRVWTATERLERADGWTEFTMDVDRRGSGLLLEIDRGAARISFAEVVFENGETELVDFNERAQSPGLYSLLDFRDGRKVDHVRIVASAQSRATELRVHLLS